VASGSSVPIRECPGSGLGPEIKSAEGRLYGATDASIIERKPSTSTWIETGRAELELKRDR
jgi:hypothetical protein